MILGNTVVRGGRRCNPSGGGGMMNEINETAAAAKRAQTPDTVFNDIASNRALETDDYFLFERLVT